VAGRGDEKCGVRGVAKDGPRVRRGRSARCIADLPIEFEIETRRTRKDVELLKRRRL
jgi:hypothetical protein